MSERIAIELNDSGILVTDEQRILVNSPGYAVKLGGRIWFGHEAQKKALLHPNNCNFQFWSELAQAEPNRINQTSINLALQHLTHIWTQITTDARSVILTVPANFTKTGLGLLLGLCNELSIPVQAMVHHAALAPQQLNHSGPTVHVETQLHSTAITSLAKRGNEIGVENVSTLGKIGYENIFSELISTIAQSFINTTRLDPLHSADTEQQLFNKLPAWLSEAQSQKSIKCQLEHDGKFFETTIAAEKLKSVYGSHINIIINSILSLVSTDSVIACVSENLDRLFGFSRQATAQGLMIRPLRLGYHALQSLQHPELLSQRNEQIYLVKQLPFCTLSEPLPVVERHPSDIADQPTHILFRNRAYAINNVLYFVETLDATDRFQILSNVNSSSNIQLIIKKNASGIVVNAVNQQELKVNSQPVQINAHLNLGDSLAISSCADELVFIKVE